MKINVNEIRVGNLLNFNNRLWVVCKTMHTQPGKGGAYMQVEMKDIQSGTKANNRFRTAETVEKVQLEQKEFQYLYDSGDTIELMDKTSYEQISLNKSFVPEDLQPFLQDGINVFVEYHGENPIMIKLPELMTLQITECEPVVKGQTAASSYKPAILENGVRVMVPPFIGAGEKIIVRVETQEYMERAK